ncbi:hypothetical protein BJX99DRAFT_218317 [Aspergillus californicus]
MLGRSFALNCHPFSRRPANVLLLDSLTFYLFLTLTLLSLRPWTSQHCVSKGDPRGYSHDFKTIRVYRPKKA